MLATGRALMSEPRVLLLDEPSLGLSPLYVKLIFNIIQEINSQTSGQVAVLREDKKVQEAYLGGTAIKQRA